MNGEEEEEEKEMEGETTRRAGRRVSTGEQHVHKSKPVCWNKAYSSTGMCVCMCVFVSVSLSGTKECVCQPLHLPCLEQELIIASRLVFNSFHTHALKHL